MVERPRPESIRSLFRIAVMRRTCFSSDISRSSHFSARGPISLPTAGERCRPATTLRDAVRPAWSGTRRAGSVRLTLGRQHLMGANPKSSTVGVLVLIFVWRVWGFQPSLATISVSGLLRRSSQ